MTYDFLHICIECILVYHLLKLVWVYWIRRPVSVHGRHDQYPTEISTGLRRGCRTTYNFWKMVYECVVLAPGARNYDEGLQEGRQNGIS